MKLFILVNYYIFHLYIILLTEETNLRHVSKVAFAKHLIMKGLHSSINLNYIDYNHNFENLLSNIFEHSKIISFALGYQWPSESKWHQSVLAFESFFFRNHYFWKFENCSRFDDRPVKVSTGYKSLQRSKSSSLGFKIWNNRKNNIDKSVS